MSASGNSSFSEASCSELRKGRANGRGATIEYTVGLLAYESRDRQPPLASTREAFLYSRICMQLDLILGPLYGVPGKPSRNTGFAGGSQADGT
jgi:hypothetical protein